MAEPYIAFTRELDAARQRFKQYRNEQTFNPAKKPEDRAARANEGARLQGVLSGLGAAEDARLRELHPPMSGAGYIDPDYTARVKASVQAQRALDPTPVGPQGIMDAAQAAKLGVSPNEFSRLRALRDSGSEALAPYKISDAKFRAGADELAKIAAENAGGPSDMERERFASIARPPRPPAGPSGVMNAARRDMLAAERHDAAISRGMAASGELAKYEAEKEAERAAAAKSRDLDVQGKEAQVRAARIAAGLEQPPALTPEQLGNEAVTSRIRSLGGEPGRVAALDREYAQIASDLGSLTANPFAIKERVVGLLGRLSPEQRASEARRLLDTLEQSRSFDRTLLGRATDALGAGSYGSAFDEIRALLEREAGIAR